MSSNELIFGFKERAFDRMKLMQWSSGNSSSFIEFSSVSELSESIISQLSLISTFFLLGAPAAHPYLLPMFLGAHSRLGLGPTVAALGAVVRESS